MAIKITLLVLFFIITLSIGIIYRRKKTDVSNFVLGGRNVGPWLTAFAYGTSYFSAVVFVGYAGQFGWSFGVSAVWIGIGNALIGSLLAWMVLGRRARTMTKHLQSATMPEFFEHRYGSSNMKIIASIITFLFLIPYSASVYKGLSGLFAAGFGIPASFFPVIVISLAALTGIYVILGGYMATAVNDLIQGIIMLAGIAAVILVVLNTNGGLSGSLAALGQFTAPNAPNMASPYTSMFGPDPVSLLGVVILTSLGAWGLPQMVHKFYTIKDDRSIKTGAIVSTIFALVVAGGSYFMGAFGRLFYTMPEGVKPVFDEIVPAMVATFPAFLIGVVLMVVLSASMSTLSSLVMASSSTFTIDFLKGAVIKDLSSEKQVTVIRILIVVFLALSVAIAITPNNPITALMSWSWGALAGSFLGPFVYGLFMKGITKAGVYASFITGVGITVIGYVTLQFQLIPPEQLGIFASPVNIGAFSMIVSLIVVPVVSLITPKLDAEKVDDCFSCL